MTDSSTDTKKQDFIREIVAKDVAANTHEGQVVTRFPPRAQRLPPHRPRQVDLPQLRNRSGGPQSPLPPPLRRHQPLQRGAGIRRLHPGRHPLARLRLGRAPPLRFRLFRPALRMGPPSHPRGKGLRRRSLRRRNPRPPRQPHRTGKSEPPSRAQPRRESRPLRAHARR